jgi:hypothetical protein
MLSLLFVHVRLTNGIAANRSCGDVHWENLTTDRQI